MDPKVPKDAPHHLLVEGQDDLHSVIHLLRHHGVDWDTPDPQAPYIEDCKSIDRLLDAIEAGVRTYERLGILMDTDFPPTARWSQVQERLTRAGLTVPETLDRNGVIVAGLRPSWKVGVWLMPDNSEPGYLEHFLSLLIPEGDLCWPYAAEVTAEAKKRGAPFRDVAKMKARIHSWLAWREEPGLPFGTALTAKYLKADSPVARPFVSWFKRLFYE